MSEELYYIDNNISQTITLNGFLSALILSKLHFIFKNEMFSLFSITNHLNIFSNRTFEFRVEKNAVLRIRDAG